METGMQDVLLKVYDLVLENRFDTRQLTEDFSLIAQAFLIRRPQKRNFQSSHIRSTFSSVCVC